MISTKKTTALIKELDDVFSKAMRLKFAVNGKVTCCGCGLVLRWTQAHWGHYVDRGSMATRYTITNGAPCCRGCNYYDEDKLRDTMGVTLMALYGVGIIEALEVNSRSLAKFMPYELEEKIDYYKEMVKTLMKTNL